MFDLFKQLQAASPALAAIVVVLGSLGSVATALHVLFAVLALKWPAFAGAARVTATIGVDFQTWAKALASALKSLGIGAAVFLLVLLACTPPQAANAIQDTNEVTTALEQACVDAALVAPLLDPTLPPADEAALKTACPAIAGFADSAIDQMIQTFTQAEPAVAAKVAAHRAAYHYAARDAGK